MIWPILGLFAGIFFACKLIKGNPLDNLLSNLFALIIFGFSGFVVGWTYGIIFTDGTHPPEIKFRVNEIKLANLRNEKNLEGGFFLATGTISESPYYVFYKQVGEGYQYSRLRADDQNVLVFEEDRKDGVLKVITSARVHSSEKSIYVLKAANDEEKISWEFHIPQGSIQRNFSLQ